MMPVTVTHSDELVERVARRIEAALIAGRYLNSEYNARQFDADAALKRAARAAIDTLPPDYLRAPDQNEIAGMRAALSAMPGHELPPNTIPVPRDIEEAKAMVLIGESMLRAAGAFKEPDHELLREALDALTPFAVGARSIDVDPPGDHEPSHGRGSVTAGDLRRARATAEKIRAELEVG